MSKMKDSLYNEAYIDGFKAAMTLVDEQKETYNNIEPGTNNSIRYQTLLVLSLKLELELTTHRKKMNDELNYNHVLHTEGDEYVCSVCQKRWGFDDEEIPTCNNEYLK